MKTRLPIFILLSVLTTAPLASAHSCDPLPTLEISDVRTSLVGNEVKEDRVIGEAQGKNILHIGKGTLEQLKGYRWLGNIRELQNVVERVVILSETVSPSRF